MSEHHLRAPVGWPRKQRAERPIMVRDIATYVDHIYVYKRGDIVYETLLPPWICKPETVRFIVTVADLFSIRFRP